MDEITYKYIDYKSEKFKQVIDLRYNILFKPYSKIEKYEYDELDDISLHLVALDKEKVVGYSRMTNVNDQGKITNVVVSTEYINRRIGFEMMKNHIIKAKKHNMSGLYLNSRLETIEFYKKVGFECQDKINISKRSGLSLQKMYIKI
ncbi:MAG: GNAT family N-acetyltransferase [Clostridium sp.]|uniref:GNAT family N-acetyltransferase n=1 Tax=Clostridium sp. TaxID=1506 RepID=UPI0025BF9649|nr:GNAT family N-acetyltransferase [Clostridium sp.]MCE5222413.1 GNAT family N-acetyltransferase [Clostridium sp.]